MHAYKQEIQIIETYIKSIKCNRSLSKFSYFPFICDPNWNSSTHTSAIFSSWGSEGQSYIPMGSRIHLSSESDEGISEVGVASTGLRLLSCLTLSWGRCLLGEELLKQWEDDEVGCWDWETVVRKGREKEGGLVIKLKWERAGAAGASISTQIIEFRNQPCMLLKLIPFCGWWIKCCFFGLSFQEKQNPTAIPKGL